MASISHPGVPLDAPAPPSTRGRAARFGGALAAMGVVVLGLGSLAQREASPATLEGVALPTADRDPEAFVTELADAWYETEVSLDAGSSVVRFSRRELGGRIDVEAAVDAARVARGRAPVWTRAGAALAGAPREMRFDVDVSTEQTREVIEALARRVEIEPEAADHDGVGGRPGVALSPVGAIAAVADGLRVGRLVVRLPVRELAAPQPIVRDRQHATFDEVVAAHETHYVGASEEGRSRNIYLAARFLDGATIEPHGQLSFNDQVGERSFERGFEPAIELAGGRRVEGIGGGVCQVAATLHAAAFFAGFDIVEHHPHTRTSTYIPAGLDAAVSWPNRDVVVQNPFPFHVRVRATANDGLLRIELLGEERAPRVEWNTQVAYRTHRQTEERYDPALASGQREVEDEGEDGAVLERTRTVYWPHGAVTERASLRYPTVHRLVRVGDPPSGGASASGGEAAE